MLAAKAALAARVDALGEETSVGLGAEHRAYLENRLRKLEDGNQKFISKGRNNFQPQKYDNKSEVRQYQPANDSTVVNAKKRKLDESVDEIKTGEVSFIIIMLLTFSHLKMPKLTIVF